MQSGSLFLNHLIQGFCQKPGYSGGRYLEGWMSRTVWTQLRHILPWRTSSAGRGVTGNNQHFNQTANVRHRRQATGFRGSLVSYLSASTAFISTRKQHFYMLLNGHAECYLNAHCHTTQLNCKGDTCQHVFCPALSLESLWGPITIPCFVGYPVKHSLLSREQVKQKIGPGTKRRPSTECQHYEFSSWVVNTECIQKDFSTEDIQRHGTISY